MLVRKWMSQSVVTISPEVSMKQARETMLRNHIHSLPVVRGGKLAGLLTDRNLARAEASNATSLDVHELAYLLDKTTIEQIMQTRPITVDLNATLSEATILFLENNIESLPVMDTDNQLTGMLTRSDLGRAFLAITSFKRGGIQIGIQMKDRPGAVLGLMAAIGNIGARIASLISNDGSECLTRDIHLHIYNVDRDKLPDLLNHFQLKGDLQYMVDLKNNERVFYTGKEKKQ